MMKTETKVCVTEREDFKETKKRRHAPLTELIAQRLQGSIWTEEDFDWSRPQAREREMGDSDMSKRLTYSA
jgi:hypothetical protein